MGFFAGGFGQFLVDFLHTSFAVLACYLLGQRLPLDLDFFLFQAGLVILPAPKVLLRLFLQGKNTVHQQSLLRLNDEIIVGSFSDSSFLPSVT